MANKKYLDYNGLAYYDTKVQHKLIPGTGITIDNNDVISSTGGGMSTQVVASKEDLPATGDESKIYLLPKEDMPDVISGILSSIFESKIFGGGTTSKPVSWTAVDLENTFQNFTTVAGAKYFILAHTGAENSEQMQFVMGFSENCTGVTWEKKKDLRIEVYEGVKKAQGIISGTFVATGTTARIGQFFNCGGVDKTITYDDGYYLIVRIG